MSRFEFINNIPEALKKLETGQLAGLENVGKFIQGEARKNVTSQGAVDTGDLRKSIDYIVNGGERSVTVGVTVNHGVYVEKGTGIYVSGGRSTPWVYQAPDGNFYMTYGQPARPFLEPAFKNNISIIVRYIKEGLSNG